MAKSETLSETAEVIQQLENIARAIRALEGLPVIDFRLARKLSDVLEHIGKLCAPR